VKYLILYLVVVNILAFFTYFIDKKKAEKGKWRIKESTLLIFSFIGGGLGSLLAMRIIRHKTQKFKFKIGVPIFTIISIIIIYFLIAQFNL